MWKPLAALAVLGALALGCATARADDPPPDPHLLEFLGSVDRLAELNPDYLSQAEAHQAQQAGTPPASTPPPPPPPPPPPRQPPPTAANVTGVHNNE
jgi:hypothetical protein